MADFNPDEFLGNASPNPQAAAPSPGVDTSKFNPDNFLNDGQILDEILGEKVPLAFSGNSPETAMNKSVVGAIDRLKMSLGNKAGNLAYLQNKVKSGEFEDVKPIDENGDELAVRQNGSWYRVDPVNGEIADPWDKTKEYLKDAADIAPALSGAGIGLATLPITNAGAAAVAGTATGAIRTSLGRLVGTYEATPVEQAWDVGLEGLLNAAGVKIAAGVKPTANWMANNIPGLAKAFSATKDAGAGTANYGKDLLKKVFAGYSVGIDNFDTMLAHPEAVKATMKNAAAKAGRNIEAYHDDITLSQMNAVRDFADNSRTMLSQLYGRGQNAILSKVSPEFSANFDKPIQETLRGALSKGIAKLETSDGQELVGEAALNALNKSPSLKGINFKLLSQEEMKNAIRGGAELSNDLGYLATNDQAYSTVKDFYKNVSTFANSANRQGVAAAKDLLNFKRLAADKAYDLTNQEHVRSMPGIKRIIDEARAGIDNTIYKSLNASGKGAGDQFLQLNKVYSDLSNELVPVLNARERYAKSGDIKVYQGLLNSFLARPGKQVGTKYAVDQAIDAAEAFGLKDMAAELARQKTAVQVGEAAKAFNPVQTGFSKAANTMQAGFGIYAAQQAMQGDPKWLAVAAATGALRSPRTPQAAAAVVRSLAKGQEYLSLLKPAERLKFMSDPNAINSFITGVTAAPIIYDQTRQQLNQAIQNAAGGGQ